MDNNVWRQLVRQALLGTTRQYQGLPPVDAALTPVWRSLAEKPPPEQLLDAAALSSEYLRAGWLPECAPDSPTPCEPESLPCCSTGAAELLARVLSGESEEYREILREWLILAREGGRRLPFEYLPELLDRGARQPRLAPLLGPVIGRRGFWLAAQNPRWDYLPKSGDYGPDTIETWETGNQASRLAWLRQCRQHDPARARQLLSATWKQEPASTRQQFLAIFWEQASRDDQAFLEQCLTDRAQAVRAQAARLLGSQEGSRFLAQHLGLLARYIRLEGEGARRKLSVEPPAVREADWPVVTDKPPTGRQLGEKAGWLYQLLLVARPAFWLNFLGLDIETYLKLARKTDYAELLRDALNEATALHRDVATWRALSRLGKPVRCLPELQEIVRAGDWPREAREAAALDCLAWRGAATTWEDWMALAELFPDGMNAELSRRLLANPEFLNILADLKNHHTARQNLKRLACRLHPAPLAEVSREFLAALGQLGAETPAVAEFVFLYTELRYSLYREFQS